MARAAAQRRKSEKPDARKRRHDGGGARVVEDTLFFTRLRKQVKWVYILLVLVFAGGFVFLGVGSGNSGIGDLLSGNFDFLGQSSSGPSAGKARERIEKNPQDAQAHLDLSRALQTDGKTAEAIEALEEYQRLRPRDSGALRELAGLYLQRAETFRRQALRAQNEAGAAIVFDNFVPANDLGKALGADPIFNALSTKANVAVSEAITREQEAYRKALGVYQEIVQLNPSDPTVQLELAQAAEAAGDNEAAIGAYEKFLKLAPEDPTVPAVKDRIKQLRSPTLGAAPAG